MSIRQSLKLFVIALSMPLFWNFYTIVESKWKGSTTFEYQALDFSPEDINFLRLKFGNNKTIPSKYELQSLIALSHYPELKDIQIEFKYQKMKTTMQARPNLESIFKKAEKRTYSIFINNSDDCEVCLDDIPFNGQVGILGHELAHILDYVNKSSGGIIRTGMEYLVNKKKEAYEKEIDAITVEKGLGWQLHACYHFIQCRKDVSDDYKSFKRKYYLEPTEIAKQINDNNDLVSK